MVCPTIPTSRVSATTVSILIEQRHDTGKASAHHQLAILALHAGDFFYQVFGILSEGGFVNVQALQQVFKKALAAAQRAHRGRCTQLRQALRHAGLHHPQVRAARGPRDHRHRHRGASSRSCPPPSWRPSSPPSMRLAGPISSCTW